MRLISIFCALVLSLQGGVNDSKASGEKLNSSQIVFAPLANKRAILTDPLLPEIIQHVRKKYGVSTVILYGSRARGEGNEKSDYDIIGVLKSGVPQEHLEVFKGARLDIALYPQKIDKEDAEDFPIAFFWEEAAILHQSHHEGEQFIKDVKKAFFIKKSDCFQTRKDRVRSLIINLDRSQENEIREHFYRHRFLTLSLVEYFPIRNLVYKGPRKSLGWLKKNDPLTYAAFRKALDPQANFRDLQVLLKQVADSELDAKPSVKENTGRKSQAKENYVAVKDRLLPDIMHYVQTTYGAHTVILYGSRAQGTASSKSDYDIIAFKGIAAPNESKRDLFKDVYLDLHFFDDGSLNDMYLDVPLGFVNGFMILCQKDNFGERFTQHIKKIYDRGFHVPDELKQKVVDEIRTKLLKINNTVAGHYYQHSLLSSLPEHYFTLRDLYYVGARESFAWIKENDLPTYYAF
jgi:predicted nucleotidyltransferase